MKNLKTFLAIPLLTYVLQSCSLYSSNVPLSENPEPIDQQFIGKWEAIRTSKPLKDSTHLFVDITNIEGDSNAYFFTYSEINHSFEDTSFFTLTESNISDNKILTFKIIENDKQYFHFALYETQPIFEVALIDESNFLDSSGQPKAFNNIDSLRKCFSSKLQQKSELKFSESFILRKR
jgi:hypothetical protein